MTELQKLEALEFHFKDMVKYYELMYEKSNNTSIYYKRKIQHYKNKLKKLK